MRKATLTGGLSLEVAGAWSRLGGIQACDEQTVMQYGTVTALQRDRADADQQAL